MPEDYIKPLADSPDKDNPDYIRGFKEALDAASQIADDLGLKLAGTPVFDELYDYVFEYWKNQLDT